MCTIYTLTNGIDESTKRVKGKIGSAIVRLARRSLMVAAREREAFGLRPSDSEEYHQQFENIRRHPLCENHLLGIPTARVFGTSDDTPRHGASHLSQSIEAKQQYPPSYSTIRSDDSLDRELVSVSMSWFTTSITDSFVLIRSDLMSFHFMITPQQKNSLSHRLPNSIVGFRKTRPTYATS